MKIFCIQLDSIWENKAANFAKARKLLAGASFPTGSLVLLPEMFATGFSMNIAALAEGARSETADFLAGAAREFGIYLMGGLVTTAPGDKAKGRNQAAVFSPEGKELVRYTKCQPFTLGGESDNYVAGRELLTFQWHDCTVAPFICYDLRFPELFREATRRKQPELFTVIASWPVKRIQHWVTLLQARAIENQAYVAGVNRTGADPRYVHTGRSIIVSPHGEILADAGEGEGVISADIDLPALRAWRAEFPALDDMRAGEARRSQKL